MDLSPKVHVSYSSRIILFTSGLCAIAYLQFQGSECNWGAYLRLIQNLHF